MTVQETQISAVATPDEEEIFPASPAQLGGVPLIELFIHLLRRKWFVARWTGVAAAAGILTSLILPIRFTAVSRIMTPQQTPSSATLLMNQLTGSGVGALAAASGGLGLKSPNDLYIGLLQSRPVADGIISRFDLVKVYRAREMTSARKRLANNTSVMSEKSGLLVVEVTDKDKNRAAEMANAYTEQLRLLTKGLAITEASQRRVFYEEQLAHAKNDLVNAAMAFEQVQRQKGLVQPDAQAKALIGGIADLRARIAIKEVELETLKSFSTERNPNVEIVKSEIASLRQQVSQLEQKNGNATSPEFDLRDLAGSGLDYLRAEHELQYRQTMFDLLLKQYDAARLDESKTAAVIQVVEPAIPPDLKSSPHRALIVMIFTTLGFACGCIWIVLAELLRRNPAGVQAIAGLKSAVLGR